MAQGWLPDETVLITRYEDPSFFLLAGFEEDVDVTTGSLDGTKISTHDLVVWREADLPLRSTKARRDDHAVLIGWNSDLISGEGITSTANMVSLAEASGPDPEPARAPFWQLDLPTDLIVPIDPTTHLVFSIGASSEKPEREDYGNNEPTEDDSPTKSPDPSPVDLHVELIAVDGTVRRVALSELSRIPPPLVARPMRANWLLGRSPKESEPALQTVRVPLELPTLARIRLVFDREPRGVVWIDRIGLAQ